MLVHDLMYESIDVWRCHSGSPAVGTHSQCSTLWHFALIIELVLVMGMGDGDGDGDGDGSDTMSFEL